MSIEVKQLKEDEFIYGVFATDKHKDGTVVDSGMCLTVAESEIGEDTFLSSYVFMHPGQPYTSVLCMGLASYLNDSAYDKGTTPPNAKVKFKSLPGSRVGYELVTIGEVQVGDQLLIDYDNA